MVTTNDIIEHPKHYTNKEIECWDWIKLIMTKDEYIAALKFALLKYIYRGGDKEDAVIGYKKARQFINKIIETLEEKSEKKSNGDDDNNESSLDLTKTADILNCANFNFPPCFTCTTCDISCSECENVHDCYDRSDGAGSPCNTCIADDICMEISVEERKEIKEKALALAAESSKECVMGSWVPNPDGDNSKDDEKFGIYSSDGSKRKIISKPMESYISIRKNNRKNKKRRRKSYTTALSLGIELNALKNSYSNLVDKIISSGE